MFTYKGIQKYLLSFASLSFSGIKASEYLLIFKTLSSTPDSLPITSTKLPSGSIK